MLRCRRRRCRHHSKTIHMQKKKQTDKMKYIIRFKSFNKSARNFSQQTLWIEILMISEKREQQQREGERKMNRAAVQNLAKNFNRLFHILSSLEWEAIDQIAGLFFVGIHLFFALDHLRAKRSKSHEEQKHLYRNSMWILVKQRKKTKLIDERTLWSLHSILMINKTKRYMFR